MTNPCTDGMAAFNSDEFRAFALKFLGFDPQEKQGAASKNVDVVIHLPCDGIVTYLLCNRGCEYELRPDIRPLSPVKGDPGEF